MLLDSTAAAQLACCLRRQDCAWGKDVIKLLSTALNTIAAAKSYGVKAGLAGFGLCAAEH